MSLHQLITHSSPCNPIIINILKQKMMSDECFAKSFEKYSTLYTNPSQGFDIQGNMAV